MRNQHEKNIRDTLALLDGQRATVVVKGPKTGQTRHDCVLETEQATSLSFVAKEKREGVTTVLVVRFDAVANVRVVAGPKDGRYRPSDDLVAEVVVHGGVLEYEE